MISIKKTGRLLIEKSKADETFTRSVLLYWEFFYLI
jgi:hypothetical protein